MKNCSSNAGNHISPAVAKKTNHPPKTAFKQNAFFDSPDVLNIFPALSQNCLFRPIPLFGFGFFEIEIAIGIEIGFLKPKEHGIFLLK